MNHKENGTKRRKKDLQLPESTLYDAVAGRLNYEGFHSYPKQAKNRVTTSSTLVPLPPEEILFSREEAPDRYQEQDEYFAHLRLTECKKHPTEQDKQLSKLRRLPDSDLLKALHAYASDFYARTSEDGGWDDWGSLDETALLALGILIEEAAGKILHGEERIYLDEVPPSPPSRIPKWAPDPYGAEMKVESDGDAEVKMEDLSDVKDDSESEDEKIKVEGTETPPPPSAPQWNSVNTTKSSRSPGPAPKLRTSFPDHWQDISALRPRHPDS